jgi:hypothetical protein
VLGDEREGALLYKVGGLVERVKRYSVLKDTRITRQLWFAQAEPGRLSKPDVYLSKTCKACSSLVAVVFRRLKKKPNYPRSACKCVYAECIAGAVLTVEAAATIAGVARGVAVCLLVRMNSCAPEIVSWMVAASLREQASCR